MTSYYRNPLSSGLLDIADVLTSVQGRGILKQAAFRRAVSSAYYALFHTFCQLTADGLGVWTLSSDDTDLAYRTIDHGRIEQVLDTMASAHADLLGLRDTVKQLRLFRTAADYSPPGRLGTEQRPISRKEAMSLIVLAREAVQKVDDLPKIVRRSLAVRLAARARQNS